MALYSIDFARNWRASRVNSIGARRREEVIKLRVNGSVIIGFAAGVKSAGDEAVFSDGAAEIWPSEAK